MIGNATAKATIPVKPNSEFQYETRFGGTDLLLILMTSIWGVNFTAIKHSLEDLFPLSFNGLRFAIASVTMLAVLRLSGGSLKLPRSEWLRFFGWGLLANAVYQTIFITGMAHTRTGNAALIASTTPFFTALVGRIRKQEYFTARGVAGLFLAFAGIVFIILSGSKTVEFGSTIVGDLMLIGSTICWTLYTVGAKDLVRKHGSVKATTAMMITATPVFLLICTPSFISQDWNAVRPLAWGGVAFSALMAIALAHSLWNHGVKKIGSTRTAVYGNVTPVVAMLAAWIVLGERPTIGQIVAACVIFIGLYFVRSGMIAVAPAAEIEEEIEEACLGPGKN
jgi:drug/metabolite transporter (DMT)-like permease